MTKILDRPLWLGKTFGLTATGDCIATAKHNSILIRAEGDAPTMPITKGSIIININFTIGGCAFGVLGDIISKSTGGGDVAPFSFYVNVTLQAGPPTFLEELHKLDNYSKPQYIPRYRR